MDGTGGNGDKDRSRGTARKRNVFRRFLRNRKGSTAIEFTALAIPFSFLVFAILESCVSFAAQELMANVSDDVARQIRTGQLKAADLDEATLKAKICSTLKIIVANDCPGLEVDLREFSTYTDAANVRIKFTADHDIDTSDFNVTPGGSLTINMLRVFYRWPVMTDMMRSAMSNLPDGKTLLFTTTTWRNEPFND